MQTQIMDAMKAAMKARDAVRLTALRAIKSALKNQEIDQGSALSDADCIKVIRAQAKQIRETIAGFEAADRGGEADEARAQLEVMESFLPSALSDDEVAALVARAIEASGATSMRDMGAVMKLATEEAAGRADGRQLSTAVKAALLGG
ncbi:MAG: glutamyl-tRNA amidotransferase [Myxococcales bacterium]|nr:glutamyl-tRNA amidotransferase [Myxococcales bacterium]|tara:strand:+ start:172 stop:615 length:444 start_codon:yes stop_codon:yes gene_type:complete